MQKRFTTVFIVSNDNRDTKFLTIDTKHFDRIKFYSVIVSSAFIVTLLYILISTLFWNKSLRDIDNLNNQIYSLKNDLKLLDSLEIKNKATEIENNIRDINNYLFERGVFKYPNSGGPGNEQAELNHMIYEYYFERTEKISAEIRNVPIGHPYTGEFKSFFGYRPNPFSGRGSEFHKGLDIKGNTGDKVICTASGTVEKADYDGGYGKSVTINHGNGFKSMYSHLSEFNVKYGDKVNAGDVIGYIGSTGRSTGPHLHYEIKYNDVSIDPKNFLNIKQ
jgi:murein DD-endopeptidase MepM/ murein hydrolase activator NlpD